MNNRDVAHRWAAQSTASASGSNFYFERRILFSYGSHFPLGIFTPFRVNGERVVVFNSQSRSQSTSRHQSYARSALHGHAVRLVHVDGINYGTALSLAEGSQDGLRSLARTLADDARTAYANLASMRSARNIAAALDSVAASLATVEALRDLATTKEDRKEYAATVGTLPTLPENAPWWTDAATDAYYRDPDAQFCKAFAATVRDTAKREAASKAYGEALEQFRHHWKGARNAYAQPIDETQQHDHARHAETALEKLTENARIAGIVPPRNLPKRAAVVARRRKLEPLGAMAWARRELGEMAIVERDHVQAFAELRRVLKHPRAYAGRAAKDPQRLLARLIRGSHSYGYGVKSLRGLDILCGILHGIANGEPNAHYWQPLNAYAAHNREAAHLVATMRERAAAFLAWCNNAIRVAHAWDERADLVNLARRVAELRDLANAPDASPRDLESALNWANRYAEARADYLAKIPAHNPDAWPLNLLPSLDLAAWEARKATAAIRASMADVEKRAKGARSFVETVQANLAAGFPFQAARNLSDAIATNGTADSLLRTLLDEVKELRAKDEPAARELADDLSFRGFYCSEFIAQTATLNAMAEPMISAAREALRDEAADGEGVELYAWRKGDPGASRPGFTAFRLNSAGHVESSLGATVTQSAARRLWALIRAVVASGNARSWGYAEGPRVGPFHLEHIRADGATKVGCHNITASEARAFARFMQWPPFGAAIAALDALPSLADVETFAAE